jgi:hypothetical protein
MHNILFDPAFLIVPEEIASTDRVRAWFETLDTWARAINTTHGWYHLRDEIIEHLGYERFPSFHMLRTIQRRYHLDITLQGIATLINTVFLQDNQSFRIALETHLLDYGLIVQPEPYTIVLQPIDLVESWPGDLVKAVANLLAEAGAAKSQGEPFSSSIVIATIDYPMTELMFR